MYEKYRIVQRDTVAGSKYILQTDTPPSGGAFNQFPALQPNQKWFIVGTYATLEAAQEAKMLYADGLLPGDKVVG